MFFYGNERNPLQKLRHKTDTNYVVIKYPIWKIINLLRGEKMKAKKYNNKRLKKT